MDLKWLPIVTHSEPLMTPIFFTERIVKNRSLSARSFQFLLFMFERSMARCDATRLMLRRVVDVAAAGYLRRRVEPENRRWKALEAVKRSGERENVQKFTRATSFDVETAVADGGALAAGVADAGPSSFNRVGS